MTELLKAACDHGFIFIKNDGIDLKPSEVEQMFHMVRLPPQMITVSL